MKKILKISLCLIFLFICQSHIVSAEDVIYVIGGENQYPIEYFDEDSQSYMGLFPDLLKEIEVVSDLRFRYLEPEKKRTEMIEEMQGELVSNITLDEAKKYSLITSKSCFENDIDKFGFAFTEIASADMQKQFNEALEIVLNTKKETLLFKYVNYETKLLEKQVNHVSIICIILCGATFLATAGYFRQKKIREEIASEWKYHDSMTGYINFEKMSLSYDKMINDNNRALYCIMSLEIDRLEDYRRLYGRKKKQQVLVWLGEILSDYVHEDELMASQAPGYYFLMLQMFSIRLQDEKMHEINSRFNLKLSQEGIVFPLMLRIGVYRLSSDDENLERAVTLANEAKKKAMQQSVIFCWFDEDDYFKLLNTRRIESTLIHNFPEKEFIPFYYPIIDMETGYVIGCESLARWESNTLGFLHSSKFFPILKQNGMICQLDYIIFEKVCKMLGERKTHDKKLFLVSCSFSIESFREIDFVQKLNAIVDKYQIAHEHLMIELENQLIVENQAFIRNQMQELKNENYCLCLKQFDSGMTFFQSLEQLPFDVVKLEAINWKNLENKTMQIALQHTIDAIHTFNTQVVFAGVNSHEDEKILKSLGCDMIQGEKYYPPLPYTQLDDLLFKDIENN